MRTGRRRKGTLGIWCATLAMLGPAIAAAQGDDAGRISHIRERAILAADVVRVARLAEACGQRDAAWGARVLRLVIARQDADAQRFGGEVEGGREAVRWLMLGARMAATAAADAEHDRYGEVACGGLRGSDDVSEVDRLLAEDGR